MVVVDKSLIEHRAIMSSEAIESTLGVNQAPAKALSSPDKLPERFVVDELGQTLTSDNCWTQFPADDESNQSRLDQSQAYKRDWTQDLDEGSKSDQDSVVGNSEEHASKRDLPQGPVDDIDQGSMENSTGESGDESGQSASRESGDESDGSSSSDSSQGSVTSDTRSQAALESGDESDGSSSSSDSSQGPVTSDTRTQAALAEIDQLSEDLRSKHASAHGRDSDRPPVLTEDDKVKLALRKSQAQVPGAFHESDEPDVKPATQDQISGLIRLKKSQKQRSPVGEDLGNPDSSTDGDVLEEMQDAMVEFQKNTNDEDAEAEAAAMKRKGRKKWGIISAVAVLLIGVIVGAAVGLTSGGETTSPEKEVPLTEEESCSAGAEDNLPERYAELQSLIVTDLPGMTSDIDTPGSSARTSLCWLVFSDALEAEAQEEDIVQRFVLGAIYFHFDASLGEGATNGLSLSNWLSPLPACEWEFIVCGLDMVQEIALSGLELRGFIPTELSLLTQLVHLKLDSNVLKGTLPSQLFSLIQLRSLDIKSNVLTGSLPSEVGKLVDLRQLAMGKNLLSGAIPDLSGLSNLSHFDIGFNARLEGTFPDIFGATNLGKQSKGTRM